MTRLDRTTVRIESHYRSSAYKPCQLKAPEPEHQLDLHQDLLPSFSRFEALPRRRFSADANRRLGNASKEYGRSSQGVEEKSIESGLEVEHETVKVGVEETDDSSSVLVDEQLVAKESEQENLTTLPSPSLPSPSPKKELNKEEDKQSQLKVQPNAQQDPDIDSKIDFEVVKEQMKVIFRVFTPVT